MRPSAHAIIEVTPGRRAGSTPLRRSYRQPGSRPRRFLPRGRSLPGRSFPEGRVWSSSRARSSHSRQPDPLRTRWYQPLTSLSTACRGCPGTCRGCRSQERRRTGCRCLRRRRSCRTRCSSAGQWRDRCRLSCCRSHQGRPPDQVGNLRKRRWCRPRPCSPSSRRTGGRSRRSYRDRSRCRCRRRSRRPSRRRRYSGTSRSCSTDPGRTGSGRRRWSSPNWSWSWRRWSRSTKVRWYPNSRR